MSKSESTTKSSATNTNIVFDDIDGIAVAGNSNTIQVLDADAIKQSFNFADDTNRRALGFADDTNRRAFGFADDALDLVDISNRRAFAFGDDALDLVDDSLSFVDDTNRRAFAFSNDALDLVDTQNSRMLDFGRETIQQALGYTQDIIMTSAEKQNEQINNLFLYLGLGALVVVGVKYVRR